MTIVFFVLNKIWGLRVSAEEEIMGLDLPEHGLPSAYADFMPAGDMFYSAGTMPAGAKVTGTVPMEKAVSVTAVPSTERPSSKPASTEAKLTKVSIIAKQSKFEELKEALNDIGVMGITVTQVLGCGVQKGSAEYYRGVPLEFNLLPKIKVEVVVSKVPVSDVIDASKKALYTGHIGDEKILRKSQAGDIYPSAKAPVITGRGLKLTAEEQAWGFPKYEGNGVIFNARSETALSKKMFADSVKNRRCIIPATGFYEWNSNKDKYFFRSPDGNILLFAGFYQAFQEESRFVILTTEANESMQSVHSRMPLILEKEEVAPWIMDSKSTEGLLQKKPKLLEREIQGQMSLLD